MPSPPLVSQHGEDHLLLTAFEGEPPGFYIDVGAFDGLHLSNTWVFEQLGWTGYCIEPAPRLFQLLTDNRPGATCVPAAAGAGSGEIELFMDPTMLLSTVTGDERLVRDHFDQAARSRELRDDRFDRVTVPLVTLDDLLRRHAPPPVIDLVSIDVEGAELDVLDGFDLAHHRPRVLVIEANDDDSRRAIDDRCTSAGYEHVRRLGPNNFYAREERLAHRLRTTRIEAFIPRSLHPLGVEYTHPDLRHDRVVFGLKSHELHALRAVVEHPAVEAAIAEQEAAAAGSGPRGDGPDPEVST